MAASEMDRARCRFLTIPATLRYSITRTWAFVTSDAEAWWIRCRRVLATFRCVVAEPSSCSLAALGPQCGSGQSLVGRLERALRFSKCFHPLEDLEGNAVRVGGDGKRGDPSVNPDRNGVTIGAASLRLVKLCGHAGQRNGPATRTLAERGRVHVEATGIDHAADLAGGTEEFDRSELGQAQVHGIAEPHGLTRGCLTWRCPVPQAEARSHLPLGLEARE